MQTRVHPNRLGDERSPSVVRRAAPRSRWQPVARRAGAQLLLFGGIHKLSTLVQWAKAQVIDMQTEQLVFDRLMTFRGDNDDAWQHAEAFLVKDITAQRLMN
jgi:hypothetical protein